MGEQSTLARAFLSCISNLAFAALLLLPSALAATNTPQVLYTDLASGPNSGGENNKGVYLSIFGLNFGAAGDLGTNTKVFINNIEVDNYRYLGSSNGRTDIQQITVQIGALGNPTRGVPLPLKVVVGGIASNTDKTFMVNPGRILFADNISGNDATASPNDISHPWRYVQTPSNGGAFGAVQPGDIIVMRGKGTAWTDLGNNNSFLRFSTKGGSQPTGASGTGPISVMSYPTETVRIVNSANYGISGVDRSNGLPYSNYSTWITISGLSIQGDGGAGPIALQVYADYWRIVNNELTAPNATTAKAGGVNGNGGYVSIFGNNIHDIAGNQQENHGVYIDGGSDIPAGSVEIAYNHIYNIAGGNCIQQYNNGSNGNFYPTNNILIHHNVVHDTTKHGINIADGSGSGYLIYDNVVYNTKFAGVRFNTTDLVGCKIYNNSFYNTNTAVSSNYGSLTNDWNLGSTAIDIRNNIFWPHAGTKYNGGSNGMSSGLGVVSNNLWFGGSDATPTFDAAPKTGNPLFVSPGADFHLGSGSPAIDTGSSGVSSIVSNDYATKTRPQGAGYDIGAFEYVAPGSSLPTVTLTLSGSPLSEAGGVATVTATLSAVSAQIVTINLGFSGTATNGTDYTPSASSIAISAGSLSGSITLSGISDSLSESNESIIVDIASVTNGTKTGTQQVTATIIDQALENRAPGISSFSYQPATPKAGETVTFTVAAGDPEGDTLATTYNYNDGATDSTGLHIFFAAGTYNVVAAVSDNKHPAVTSTVTVVIAPVVVGSASDSDGDGVSDDNEIADGTNPLDPNSLLKSPMTVKKLSGTTSFKITGHDSCSVSGVIPGLPATFKPGGASITFDAGGATESFILDDKGKASSKSGTFALKLKYSRNRSTKKPEFLGGDAGFKATLKLGTWSDDWGIPLDTPMIKQKILIVVDLHVASRVYSDNVEALCTSKPGTGARLKK